MMETVHELIIYCRSNGRVCPQPTLWNELWQLLPNVREWALDGSHRCR